MAIYLFFLIYLILLNLKSFIKNILYIAGKIYLKNI